MPSGHQSNTHDDISTLDSLIDQFDTAMLVTHALSGELRARPMMIAAHRDVTALYFATRIEDEKTDEIIAVPEVAVTMQSSGRYLSLSGHAKLATQDVEVDELWSASWRLWFPDGPDDSQLAVIRVTPSMAEYWDRTGLNRLEFLWEAGKALLDKKKAKDDGLRGHGKVELRRSH